MKINIENLLEYFDLKNTTNYGDTTALISVVGEDLCAAIFKHYCEMERSSNVEILDPNRWIPTTLKKIGKRLDRWIIENKDDGSILYQTEIKNWCSRAIGGVDVPIDAGVEEIDKLSEINWLHHITNLESSESNGLNKVLVDMVSDKNLNINRKYAKEALLILWHCSKPSTEKDYFFTYRLPNKHFSYDYLHVFSCSLYLRYLVSKGISELQLIMPNVERRVAEINRVFKI